MKTQYFRVKKGNERLEERYNNKKRQQSDETHLPNSQLTDLISLLHTFVQQNQQNINPPEKHSQLQPRDKHPMIPWNVTLRHAISDRQLQIWITNVCRNTFSTAFNYYYTDQLSYEQTRVFCAETLIKNILKLTERMKLTSNQIKTLDQYIQNKILPYMLKKYPLTGEKDVNKALENVVEQINSFDQLQNDFIYITDVKFSYRKSGNYNDLVMIVLNKILKMIDQPSKSQNNPANKDYLSNYKDFELTMSTIFQKVEDISWMDRGINIDNEERQHIKKQLQMTESYPKADLSQKQKYRQKVKDYTHYLIGRKVSQNVDHFSIGEIENEHLVVKHSSILRILTKWCEELQGKFTNVNYMKQHLQNIETLGGDINSLNDEHRDNLDEKLHNQMALIREYLQKLKQAFYNEQSCELLRHLEPDDYNYIQPYEKAFGKFSCQTVKNLHTFIIKYLNRLIHGLVKVSYNWHRESGYKNNYEKWSYPPNLVTFKVGDLIRCKCSSQQKEILSIFNELNKISARSPQKLKIIRIKNRLKTQSNDILINIKFNNCLIGQIQLAVNTKKSKFAQYSNNFNHYIYQLQRCIFGPISQVANIWKNIDIRSKQFQDIIRLQGRAQVGLAQINKTQSGIGCNHEYLSYQLPFRCTFCRNYHSHNDLVISNVQCSLCNTFKCMRCQTQSMDQEELKLKVLVKKYDQLGKKAEQATNQMPSYGFYIQTDSKTPKILYFKQYKINGILYYLGKKNNKIYQVIKNDEKSMKNFFYHNLVFKLKEQTNQFIKMSNSEVKQYFILPQYVQSIYKSEKQVLFLNQKKINPDKWETILNNRKYRDSLLNIKKVEISNNDLTTLQFISDYFPNLQSITSDLNKGCKIHPLTKLKNLKQLVINRSQLEEIPSLIMNLNCLEELNIYKNKVKILPLEIFGIRSLKILNLKYNLITELPQQLASLTNLNQLLLRGNNLESIPDWIENLTNLTILNVGKCGLKVLNSNIGKLTELKILDLAGNELTSIPDSFCSLVKLQKFKLQENKFQSLPQFISNFTKLKQFTLYSNIIEQITLDFSNFSQLDTLNLSNNKITHIEHSIIKVKSLTQFYLHDNQYQDFTILAELNDLEELSLDVPEEDPSTSCLPQEICSLNNLLTLKIKTTKSKLLLTPSIKNLNQLEQLYLSNNGLVQVPQNIILLTSLEKISFEGNQLQSFPVEYLRFLSKLEEINFKRNKFIKIEKELIGAFSVLDFSENQIREVCIQNAKNTKLTKLILRQNSLTTIPKNIFHLKKLKELDMSYNNITNLEENLNQLRNMQYLSFHIYGNPLKEIHCVNFIESQMCDESKIFISTLVVQMTMINGT